MIGLEQVLDCMGSGSGTEGEEQVQDWAVDLARGVIGVEQVQAWAVDRA